MDKKPKFTEKDAKENIERFNSGIYSSMSIADYTGGQERSQIIRRDELPLINHSKDAIDRNIYAYFNLCSKLEKDMFEETLPKGDSNNYTSLFNAAISDINQLSLFYTIFEDKTYLKKDVKIKKDVKKTANDLASHYKKLNPVYSKSVDDRNEKDKVLDDFLQFFK